jgi:ubiquinone/menaquinone biosynthesis C-methylase UbiE
MLSRARAKVDASHVRFLRHDLREPLPFDSESFDLVTFDLVLEHLGALDAPFSEAARVLRPGGRLVVVELHPSRQRLGRQARFATGDTTVHIEAHFHSLADYVAAMTRAGVLLTELGEWTLHDGRALPATERRLVPRVLSLVARRE